MMLLTAQVALHKIVILNRCQIKKLTKMPRSLIMLRSFLRENHGMVVGLFCLSATISSNKTVRVQRHFGKKCVCLSS